MYSPSSTTYKPTSPDYNSASTARTSKYSPESGIYKLTSPDYVPPSREYSPSVPYYGRPTSAKYSPTSPEYSPSLLATSKPDAGRSSKSPIYVGSSPSVNRSSSPDSTTGSIESVAGSVTFGRDSPSPPLTPISPIGKVVRAVRSLGNIFSRHSVSASPEAGLSPIDRSGSAWQNVRRAQGQESLELAVKAFLEDWSVENLLGWIADEHDERAETTVFRFGLRYLEGRGWADLDVNYQAKLIGQMLLDELYLPGQRLSTALRRWRGIVDMAETFHGDHDDAAPSSLAASATEEEVPTRLLLDIQAFIDDQGTRLIEVMEEIHAAEAEIYFRNLINFEDNVRIIHEPHPSEADVIAFHISGVLMGTEAPRPLIVSSMQPVRGVLPEWEEYEADDWSSTASDEFVIPESERWSLQAIGRAASMRPVRWRRVFQRVQRHIDSYGLDATVRQYWALLDDDLKQE
ncbi:hypothetical protein LTR85_002852 [Meristemomyces frigidus]|nr:hypothetical protein LTR85_002852 [Meristemomyces frigidus]